MNIAYEDSGEKTNRKRLICGLTSAATIMVAVVLVIMLLPEQPLSLFTVTGKQQPMESIHNGYEVINWKFTFAYKGEKTLQNVNLYLNNASMPFKSVPEVTKSWTFEHIWTPGDISANATITISMQGGTEHYEFQP